LDIMKIASGTSVVVWKQISFTIDLVREAVEGAVLRASSSSVLLFFIAR